MALGVRRMAQQRAIVRKRMALEALGSITNICSDKTGTLTQGKMVVTQFFMPGKGFFAVSGQGYKPVGKITPLGTQGNENSVNNAQPIAATSVPTSIARLVECGALCNMAVIKRKGITQEREQREILEPRISKAHLPLDQAHHLDDDSLEATDVNDWEAIGDPTEAALQSFAWKLRLGKPHIASRSTEAAPMCFQVLQEYSFDSTLKRMSVVYVEKPMKLGEADKHWAFSKGAVEAILNLSDAVITDNGSRPWSDSEAPYKKETVLEAMETLAGRGLRVLALAYRTMTPEQAAEIEHIPREAIEKNLTFLGLVGIYDPPRLESRNAVAECRQAGITVHMLTGDHPKTASSIAREIGILKSNTVEHVGEGYFAMTAVEFDRLKDEDIDAMRTLPSVIARCSPTTKVKMVDALQRRRKIVAMTGDGTNDAPSLKRANVGIAMGMNGSDVAKQASSIVLTDDNFATIVRAVSEGRRIFANIQKFILHLMSGNVAEIIALIIGLAYRDTNNQSVYPMSPVQILFLNMVTSSPPAMGLGMEPPTPDLMQEPPRDPSKPGSGLFTKEAIVDILYYGSWMGILTLVNWSTVLYIPPNMQATNNNPLGSKCNETPKEGGDYYPGCEVVFRARSASFVTLTLLLFIHAYNCRSMRGSLFTDPYLGGFAALKTNMFLLWSVIGGTLATILSVYIPKCVTGR
jgi:potassium/sodium efflux P-type ATPase